MWFDQDSEHDRKPPWLQQTPDCFIGKPFWLWHMHLTLALTLTSLRPFGTTLQKLFKQNMKIGPRFCVPMQTQDLEMHQLFTLVICNLKSAIPRVNLLFVSFANKKERFVHIPASFSEHHEGPAGTWQHSNGEWKRNDVVAFSRHIPLRHCKPWISEEIDVSLTKDDHKPGGDWPWWERPV